MDTRGRDSSNGDSNPGLRRDHAFTIYSNNLHAASPRKERRTPNLRGHRLIWTRA
jgi:hypothetical protein